MFQNIRKSLQERLDVGGVGERRVVVEEFDAASTCPLYGPL
jgi:hypothetical protein